MFRTVFRSWVQPFTAAAACGCALYSVSYASASGISPSLPPSSLTSEIHSLQQPTNTDAASRSLHSFKVDGLSAAVFTPMKADGAINPAAIPALVKELQRGGIRSVFACGTSGENRSLSVPERKVLMEHWVSHCHSAGIQVIAHIGAESLEDSKVLAAHAEHIGADAIAALSPSYYKPATIHALIEWLVPVAAAAPRTPFYYYHIPFMSGVRFNMLRFLEAVDASGRIPTFRGMKFTDTNVSMFSSCVKYAGGKYNVLLGFDDALLAGLALGGNAGSVGMGWSFMGKVANEIMAAFQEGNLEEAQLAQDKVASVMRIMDGCAEGRYGEECSLISAGKAILEVKGVPVGPPRLPFLPLSEEAKRLLLRDLKEIGFFRWC